MNNFEKRKMLDYLIKLLPVTDTNDYSFDDVFDFLCLEFNINRKPYPSLKNIIMMTKTQILLTHQLRKKQKINKKNINYTKSLQSTVNLGELKP